MVQRIIVPVIVFLAAALQTLSAAGVAGTWKGNMARQDGSAMEVTLALKAEGDKLTGTVTNSYGEEQITDGVVKGDDVSFIVLAGGGQFRIVYKGKLTGDEIKFKVTVGDFGDQELTAKRQP